MDNRKEKRGREAQKKLYRTDHSTIGFRTLESSRKYEQIPEADGGGRIYDPGAGRTRNTESRKGGRVVEPKDPYDVSQLTGYIEIPDDSYEDRYSDGERYDDRYEVRYDDLYDDQRVESGTDRYDDKDDASGTDLYVDLYDDQTDDRTGGRDNDPYEDRRGDWYRERDTDYDYESDHTDEERARERRASRREKRREQERRRKKQMWIRIFIAVLILAAVICGALWFLLKGKSDSTENAETEETEIPETESEENAGSEENTAEAVAEETAAEAPYDITETADTIIIPDLSEDTSNPAFVDSKYVVLFDVDSGEIVAERDPDEVISPASMTKILTILTAADHITEDQLEDRFTMTQEIADYTYTTGCTVAGFEKGSSIRVEELFYGTILPSGADGAAGLAYYVGGSIEGFAELMNEEVQVLGRSATAHFDNPVGVYSENNRCTVKDMGIIMKAAMDNDFCAEVLSAHTYQCTATNADNPDGILLSNWFLRRIEDKDSGGTVVAAKTGYVAEAGFCAASYFESASGRHYICVTANTYSTWRSIYDHAAIYKTYAK